MSNKISLFWFRRDLRLDDNAGLFHALQNENEVLPIFIFDTTILSQLKKDDSRVTYIHELLLKIQSELTTLGRSLAVFHGTPIEIFQQLISENLIDSVFTNHDYEPYARKRDKELNELFKKHHIDFKTCKDQVIFEKNEIIKDNGTPYVVFTPYSKKWKEKFKRMILQPFPSEKYLEKIKKHSYPFLSLDDIDFVQSSIQVKPFSTASELIQNYAETRNFPAISGTSLLAPHLRFGAISIRKVIIKVSNYSNDTFLNELIWREFFMQILWHFPQTINQSFRPKYDAIIWENDEIKFQKWCQGKTGYPIVDAGMRELNATGHMHNRVRMIVASFLCKHLLIDWRWGEAYFANKLLDYEQSSNIGNWQWAAGCGVDAAPYFRIFNPTEQVKKFDKDLRYIKKWVPELDTALYPKPIVEHKEAREKCLNTYKKALS
jgi:deoxyribodipyrimidine photo-lyase